LKTKKRRKSPVHSQMAVAQRARARRKHSLFCLIARFRELEMRIDSANVAGERRPAGPVSWFHYTPVSRVCNSVHTFFFLLSRIFRLHTVTGMDTFRLRNGRAKSGWLEVWFASLPEIEAHDAPDMRIASQREGSYPSAFMQKAEPRVSGGRPRCCFQQSRFDSSASWSGFPVKEETLTSKRYV